MEEWSYTSTHPLGHTGPVTGSLYLYLYMLITFRLCYQNKQGLLPYTTVTGFYNRRAVFTARYGLSPYTTQIRFVFKGISNLQWLVNADDQGVGKTWLRMVQPPHFLYTS